MASKSELVKYPSDNVLSHNRKEVRGRSQITQRFRGGGGIRICDSPNKNL